MFKVALRHVGVIVLFIFCLTLAGCFQPAGSSLQPTTVDLTMIATPDTPTPFITPLPPEGFTPPTDVPSPTALPTLPPAEPSATPTIEMFGPTTTPTQEPPTQEPPTREQPTLPPTEDAVQVVIPTLEASPTINLLPTPTGLPTDPPCTHTVQPNEWLLKIARLYNVDAQALLAANPWLAGNPNALQVGQVLQIPGCAQPVQPQAPQPTQASSEAGQPPDGQPPTEAVVQPPAQPTAIQLSDRIYIVIKGDTLGAIARKFGVTVQQLKDANGIGDGDFIREGQKLKIPLPAQ